LWDDSVTALPARVAEVRRSTLADPDAAADVLAVDQVALHT
jgi:hypothetical protein